MFRSPMRTVLSAVTALLILATAFVVAPGSAASAASPCQGDHAATKQAAQKTFKNRCGQTWDDQKRHQCTWVAKPSNGWICHEYAPNGIKAPTEKPQSGGKSQVKSSSSSLTKSRSQLDTYWTPERMKKAAKRGLAPSLGTSNRAASRLGGAVSATSIQRKTTGLLYLTAKIGDKAFDTTCSASVVTSQGKNTVWTAGHCVHLDGKWVKNVMFAPGSTNGNSPYGRWPAKQIWSLEGWTRGGGTVGVGGQQITGGDVAYDIGVVVVSKLDGRHLQDRVGANGMRFDTAPNKYVRAFGYPSGNGNDSRKLIGCESRLDNNPGNPPGMYAIYCPLLLSGGASGGPVFLNERYLVGVHSGGLNNGYVYHAKFGQGARNLYNATKNR